MDWFQVDKEGLAKILARKGKEFVFFELLQNAWDTKAETVEMTVLSLPNKPFVQIEVKDDDPHGFSNLAHAFTLFAESEKKGDPTKRGRFNLGEKLVLALCTEAEIRSTKGVVYFDSHGRSSSNQAAARLERGSIFRGTVRMTRDELAEAMTAVRTLIPPASCVTRLNGEILRGPEVAHVFETTLPTEVADAEGFLRKTERKCQVRLYAPKPGQPAMLYEMGIPVVETGDKWHVNVMQKVPLNSERDNVTPAYLRLLRTMVLNQTHAQLEPSEAAAPWVREAAADDRCSPEAVETVITKRFGEKRVIADPNDPEGTKLAIARGYTVIPGGALSAGEWRNVKAAGAALPAGKVTPSPKPFSPDGEPLKLLPPENWSTAMVHKVNFIERLAVRVLGATVAIDIANDPHWGFAAAYGKGHLTLNAGRLGFAWFERAHGDPEVVALLSHEFAHHFAADHLSEEFHRAICKVGAAITWQALAYPDLFRVPV
jgi:hypothetical protein